MPKRKRNGINARAWMATLSTAGRPEPRPTPEPTGRPLRMTVDQWDGTRFVERVVEWDGEKYVYAKEEPNA